MTSLTVARHRYRWDHALLNRLLGVLEWLRPGPTGLNAEAVLRSAERKTGLSEWGDPRFRLALSALEARFNTDQNTALGRLVGNSTCIQAACNRLRLQKMLADHPAIDAVTVERPIFVLGLPRTGTSLMQYMLSMLPERRALRFWEIVSPVPVHDRPEVDQRRRRAIALTTKRAAYFMAPEQRDIHPVDVDTYEECWPLLFSSFAVVNHELSQGIPGWGDWLYNDWDMRHSYEEYARFLKLFSWQDPRGLVLKCPEHLWYLGELLSVFPDAAVLWLHRDPCAVLPSYASLISLSHRTLRGRIDPPAVGAQVLEACAKGLERASAYRDNPRVMHVSYTELTRNPRDTLARVSEHAGVRLDEATGHRIADEAVASPLDTRTVHRYSLEQWGLSEDSIRDRMARYLADFSPWLS